MKYEKHICVKYVKHICVNNDKFLSQTPWIADKSPSAEENDLSRPARSNFRVLLLPFRSLSATFQSNFREKKLQVLLLPFRPLFFFVTSYCRNMSLPIFPNTTVKRCLAGSLFWDTFLTLFFTSFGTLFWNTFL